MQHPQQRSGFTLLEIMIVVAIIAILAFLAVPNFIRARHNAQKSVCIENLVKIEEAKQIFGVERLKKTGDMVEDTDLFGIELYIKRKPECPNGGSYLINAIGTDAECTLGPTQGHVLPTE